MVLQVRKVIQVLQELMAQMVELVLQVQMVQMAQMVLQVPMDQTVAQVKKGNQAELELQEVMV
jgi:hypothetical protein